MQSRKLFFSAMLAFAAVSAPASAYTGIQVGSTGRTYASSSMQCALNPLTGMAPMVQAGLYNPKKNASATAWLNRSENVVATVTFLNPDATVWLSNGVNTVAVEQNPRTVDSFTFDASLTFPGQLNICIPSTNGNFVAGDLETAASSKSSATVTPGCAVNPLTGRAQPTVNLFDNGSYLLNVSVNNVALTQLNGTTRTHAPAFLAPGLNVISAANGALSTDYYVRDGGAGTCTLP
jgi:hypothetical protein